MFKLQRLEITGFKSFADYTEIVFTGNGITAVVGPNGCGKSNVSDCISWVLGEQRAKSLRGAEMKDVVFQGTKNRKPSGMAEVVLHLVRDEDVSDNDGIELDDIDATLNEIDEQAVDVGALQYSENETDIENVGVTNGSYSDNAEFETVRAAQVGSVQTVERTIKTKRHWRPRSFALDFAPGEAVSVTRRLYLSGESEYQLNGKTCRLRDIQDLFAGTGLSGSHYAIIEQGRIGQILSAKPADRRNLLEEAAGISKFRTRQRAAEARLESARSNLGRISDIVSEIEKQANSLRRQAAKTRRYIALRDEFRELLRHLYAAEGKHFSELIEILRQKHSDATSAEKELSRGVERKEKDFRKATDEARAAEESLAEIRKLHSEKALERDRAEREHRYRSEQIVGLNNRSQAILTEIDAANARSELITAEIDRLSADDAKERAEADASRLILEATEKVYSEKMDEVRLVESELEAHRNKLLKQMAAVERLDEYQNHLNGNRNRLNERLNGLFREAERTEEALTEFRVEANNAAEAIKAETAKLNGFQEEKLQLLVKTSAARDELRIADENLRAVESEFSRTKNRLETLRELEEKRTVYAPQIQKLFTRQAEIGVGFAGVLADILNVEEKAERAVEHLLGPLLQSVLVASEKDAKKLSFWLRSNAIGRVAVLVAPADTTSIATTKSSRGKTLIEDLLGVSDEVRELLRKVFPAEMSTQFVDDLIEVEPVNGTSYADTNGDLLIGGRMAVIGNDVSDKKSASLLAFKRELSELQRAQDKLSKTVDSAAKEAETRRRAVTAVEEETVDLQSLIIKVERGLLNLEHNERNLLQEVERAERHQRVIRDEQELIQQEILDADEQLKTSEVSRQAAESERESLAAELESINKRLGVARERSEAENAVLSEKRTLAATSGERRRSVQSALRRVENERKDTESRISALSHELREIETNLSDLRKTVSAIANLLGSVESDQETERTELDAAVAAVTAAREVADAASSELADLNRHSAEAINERSAIEVQQTEAVTRLENLKEKCYDELHLELSSLVNEEPVIDEVELDQTRANVEEIRDRLEGFGAINMLAVEELGETEERLVFLTGQRQDIVDSIRSADEALKEIKERSRSRFKDAFESINANFAQFFRELFGGGRGEMTLLESEDVLEAGIEVVAQPPGKRLQNILLLSGGEKAMTAIALVLAIFKYRPSPFCLLDEVDAPLDDANVGRFVNKIEEMAEKTQFIVITHNKRTMEAARALYGVTMQEPGVSRIVSVKFD
ncbi:MAG: chromosome segregation protein SMC [Acidobacteriota bacterium]